MVTRREKNYEKTFRDRGSGCINPNQITSMVVSYIMFEIIYLISHNIGIYFHINLDLVLPLILV